MSDDRNRTDRDAPSADATFDGAPAARIAASGDLAPGRVIAGRYEIVRRLGSGAMGAVYEARHRAVERRVAVKVLHPGIDHDAATLQRFMVEARAAGRARHRNIVEVIDFGVEGATHWMVLEYLDGETLEACVEREAPMDPSRVIALLDPILRAVAHAHSLGFIHRDLKPENLFLAREAGVEGVVPKVLDFGIAKNTASAARLTATESIVGTPAYMAPEQIESSRDVTAAADQYALGCVAFEMLTGRIPIGAETLHALLINKLTTSPASLREARLELPEALCACVMRALERDPARRHGSVESFRLSLVASLAVTHSPAAERASEAPEVVVAPAPELIVAAPEITVTPREEPPPAPGRRKRVLALVAAVAVLVSATLSVFRSDAPHPVVESAPSRDASVAEASHDVEVIDTNDRDAASHALLDAAAEITVDVVERRDHGARIRHANEGPAQGRRLAVDPTNPL